MQLKKYLTFRVYIVLIVIFLMLIAISPRPWSKGVEIKSVDSSSIEFKQGIRAGEILKTINGNEIKTVIDYNNVIKNLFKFNNISINIETDKGSFSYEASNNIGFTLNNLTIRDAENFTGLSNGLVLKKINGNEISNISEFENVINKLIEKKRVEIATSKRGYIYLSNEEPKINIGIARTSNIRLGLDLEGGARVLLQPETNGSVTDRQINDLIDVLENRLNVYGLSDLRIFPASDLQSIFKAKYVVVEIAGATKEDVRELIGKQGIFEARIGEQVAFIGSKNDVPYVCRGDGSCSGVTNCDGNNQEYYCRFEFVIHLSGDAAKRHAEITNNLKVNKTEGKESYLEKSLDLYLDDKLVDSLMISSDLKGKETTEIMISGPGYGRTQEEAYNTALNNMNKLQTILITGSLPLKLNIIKLDNISPIAGQAFLKNSLIAGLIAMIVVSLLIFLRYRKIKIVIPIILTMLFEVIIILGISAAFRKFWVLDLAAIAGIIASVGTGVDDQIVITDELLKGQKDYVLNWKQRIKRAFFIIFCAYAVLSAAMLPLLFAGAGLLKGFAIATLVGVTGGVLITRPAYASIIEKIVE